MRCVMWLAAGLRDWFTRQLLENKVDASRVEVTAASPERAAEVRRSPRYERFVVSYGFELTFVTQP